jgi:hypothetical protein
MHLRSWFDNLATLNELGLFKMRSEFAKQLQSEHSLVGSTNLR